MNQIADVVIIGGGIQGVSAAYHIAEMGIKNVKLVEMEEFGSGTTRYTASWFVMQSRQKSNIQLSKYSYNEFLSFKDKFDADINFRQIGSLSINTTENNSHMMESANSQRNLGVVLDIFDPRQIVKAAPFLYVDDVGLGLFCPQDGLVDAFAVLHAYRKHANNLGADLRQGVQALSIDVVNDKVVGVQTTDGYISTPIIVNAAGIYDKVVAKWASIELPTIKAIRHTIFTEPTSLIHPEMTLVEILNPEVMYIGGEGGAAKYSIGLDEIESFAHKPNLFSLMEKYGDSLMHRMPKIAELKIVNCIAGIRSLPLASLKDKSVSQVGHSLPILGPVEEVSGYYNDCAWGGLGIAHSPAGGRLIAEAITGSSYTIDMGPFLLSRYKET